MTKNQKIEEIVSSRYIENVFPSKELFKKQLTNAGGELEFYIGVDPTAPQLHLGHSTNLLLLKKIQKLGHRIIVVVGDFTARIGDPTGKDAARKPLTEDEVKANMKDYKEQIAKVLDIKGKDFKYNNDWFSKMTLKKFIETMSPFTVNQMIQRDMFQKRIKEKKEIYLNEFLYPLLQGYDSLHLEVDGEVGGNDQTFNMLVGRDLIKKYYKGHKGQIEKIVIATKLLINPKTNKKLMSKSEGGYVALNDKPNDMYGKVMALPDEVILTCFELCTELLETEINNIKKTLKSNPRDAKVRLAKEIVTMYHSSKAADKAEKEFENVFKEKKVPTKIPTFIVVQKKYPLLDLLFYLKLANSKSDAKRIITQGGLKIDGKVFKDWKSPVEIKNGMVVQVGKRKFAKIKTS